jgi:hypothetical protein
MNPFSSLALGFTWLAILGIAWLGWQLLRQNGRLLLRLEELEKRLNELEFGEGDQLSALPEGAEAPGFELTDLEGKQHTLSQYRGQSVLLIFSNSVRWGRLLGFFSGGQVFAICLRCQVNHRPYAAFTRR